MYTQIVKNIFRNVSLDYPGLFNREGSTIRDVNLTINGSTLTSDKTIDDGIYLITNGQETDITSSGAINDYHKFVSGVATSDIFVFSKNEIQQKVNLHKLEYILSSTREEAYNALQNQNEPVFIIYLLSTESLESNLDKRRSLNDFELTDRFGIIFRGTYILYQDNEIQNVDLITEYDNNFIKAVLFSLNSINDILQVNFDNVESRGLTTQKFYYTDYIFSIKRTLSFDNEYIQKRERSTQKEFKYNISKREDINA